VTNPSHIGQYRIIRKIGAGGMGLVFLGEHTLLGRRAAIKTLLPTVAANKEIVERFFNEARATSAISDPGVIQVFDFGYHVDGTAYIVMELLEGEALSKRIERLGRLPLADALRIARQLAGSLAVAHTHHIVHRDLKPENVFLIRDAEAQGGERTKILDFGICKFGSDDGVDVTHAGVMVGTPVYMSPEQCRGGEGVDHRSDIYAFGCLLFHMVTGRPPFIGDATGDLIVAHLEEDPPAASLYVAGLPTALDALLLRCLAKAPGDRFQSMTDVQSGINELYGQLDGLDVSVDTVTPAVPLGRGFRSIYDANFANRAGGTPGGVIAQNRLPWLHISPPPTSSSSDELEQVVPRRSSFGAVLACVLVLGVVVGLLSTSYIIYSNDRREEAEARRQAADRSELATASPPVFAPATEDHAPAAAPALAATGERPAAEPAAAERLATKAPAAAPGAAALPAAVPSSGSAAAAPPESPSVAGTASAHALLTAPVTPAIDVTTSAGQGEVAGRSPASLEAGEPVPSAPETERQSTHEAKSEIKRELKQPRHQAKPEPRSEIKRDVTPAPRTETRPETTGTKDGPITAPPPLATPPSDPGPPVPPVRPAPHPTEDLYDTR
jgi:serine/threonine protein kinase